MRRTSVRPVLISLLLAGLLSACAEEPGSGAVAAEALSRELRPADAALAGIYDRSCRSCHTVAATGAPLTGDAKNWSVRLDKGMGTLVDNVVNGFGGMPPFGMCMDCDVDEFEAVIDILSETTLGDGFF